MSATTKATPTDHPPPLYAVSLKLQLNSLAVVLGEILINHIAPIFLAAGSGYAAGRLAPIDVKPVSRLTFYLFTPCLVFTSIMDSGLDAGEFSRMALFTVLTIAAFGVLSFAFGKTLRLERHTLAGLMVVSMFGNAGNYGLSLNSFAFGSEALARAVVYYVTSTLLVYTVGVIVASSGRAPLKQSLAGVFKVPALYGLALAAILRFTGAELPLPLYRTVKTLSLAAIPVMLIILGLQLSSAKRPQNLPLVTAASAFQLIIGPLVGIALATWLGLAGATRQAAIIESSMPTAVITTILAVEYDIDPVFVTGVVLVTTLLSPLILTPLIAYLQ